MLTHGFNGFICRIHSLRREPPMMSLHWIYVFKACKWASMMLFYYKDCLFFSFKCFFFLCLRTFNLYYSPVSCPRILQHAGVMDRNHQPSLFLKQNSHVVLFIHQDYSGCEFWKGWISYKSAVILFKEIITGYSKYPQTSVRTIWVFWWGLAIHHPTTGLGNFLVKEHFICSCSQIIN